MKTKKVLAGLVLLSAMIVSTATIQAAENESLSKKFDKILASKFTSESPGAAVLVAKKGEIIYHKGFGMANLELGVPMEADMVFRIGSITKQFTAVAILQLMEQGKLSPDDEITKFIPDYPTHGHRITIHHLLTHTSGIKSYTGMTTWNDEMRRQDITPREMIDFFKDQPMDFEPGEKYLYNNSGYFLLGYIVEKASGQSYEDYVVEHLFEPAGMTNSMYGNDIVLVKNRAGAYQQGSDGFENAAFLSMTQPYAAGSLMSTVEDMFRWNRALQDGKIISKTSLEKAFRNYTLNNGDKIEYGYGWIHANLQGFQMIYHGGGINGFLTHEAWFPEKDIYIAMFVNCTCIGTDAANEIAAIALGKPFDYNEIEMPLAAFEDYIGVYKTKAGDERVIFIEEGNLISRRIGGGTFRIIPFEKDKFFFENSLTRIEFERDEKNAVKQAVTKTATGFPEFWEKTDLPIPEGPAEIKLPAEILSRYVGKYELMPGFIIAITLEDGHLMSQASGQDKFEIFAESENEFFLKVVDARLEFVKDETGENYSLILRQSGMEFEGKRVD